MVDRIQLGEQWYILATASPPDERRRVLKQDELFGLFDRFGDIKSIGLGEEGLYLGDTCFLSRQELLIGGVRPMYLNSTVRGDNGLFIVELMNPDLERAGAEPVAKGELHIVRAKLLWDDACYEHIRIANFGLREIATTLELGYGADYQDIFEVRGFRRSARGCDLPAQTGPHEVVLAYRGLDDTVRRTRISLDPAPDEIDAARARYRLSLAPKGEMHVYQRIACEEERRRSPTAVDYFDAFEKVNASMGARNVGRCRIRTSDPLFNSWLDRSSADLTMLGARLDTGHYPYAGLPWYSTTFGRDGILTAHQYLWIDPQLARGVLGFLAATQAEGIDTARDAEPGKILHEARRGELAARNEIPFGRYYGTVDATPLFVGLAGAYYERTGDLDFIRSIWGNIRRALQWIDQYGDRDGDGFVEYARATERGLVQQGWKDSHDSVFHSDGRLADAPIALCEVQAYVYGARLQAARLARLLDEPQLALELEQAAQALKQSFDEAFWCAPISMYALALDGDKKQCAVPSSNAGHALWSGIARPERAAAVVRQLMKPDFFCGWGIRTIPSTEVRYNPMAYHNGSVWPHDNALIAEGMARYGFTDQAMRIFEGMREACLHMDQHRMPELFCGFTKRTDEGPTLYPVACTPQAWAAASVFSLLQSCLGLSFDAERSEIRLRHPQLPPFLDTVHIENLTIGDTVVDLTLQRYPSNVGVKVERKQGNAEIVTVA